MKKVIVSLFILAITLSTLVAQGAKEGVDLSKFTQEESSVEVRVGALKGPTAMGLAELITSSKDGAIINGNSYSFTLEGAADALVPLLVKGELDIACIPANLASVLYNNTKKIQAVAVNTLGVLYICQYGGSEIKSLDDLKGKVIYSAGKGSVPQYTLEAVLEGNGFTIGKDVDIEWKSEHAEAVAALLATGGDGSAVAMLPQPFATTAMMKDPSITIAIDLNSEWEELTGEPLVTGVAVATTAFINEHSDALNRFLESYSRSVKFVNDNNKEASIMIENAGIIKAAAAERALPYCNIVLYRDKKMENALEEYYGVLYKFNPKSIGGSLPDGNIYYSEK